MMRRRRVEPGRDMEGPNGWLDQGRPQTQWRGPGVGPNETADAALDRRIRETEEEQRRSSSVPVDSARRHRRLAPLPDAPALLNSVDAVPGGLAGAGQNVGFPQVSHGQSLEPHGGLAGANQRGEELGQRLPVDGPSVGPAAVGSGGAQGPLFPERFGWTQPRFPETSSLFAGLHQPYGGDPERHEGQSFHGHGRDRDGALLSSVDEQSKMLTNPFWSPEVKQMIFSEGRGGRDRGSLHGTMEGVDEQRLEVDDLRMHFLREAERAFQQEVERRERSALKSQSVPVGMEEGSYRSAVSGQTVMDEIRPPAPPPMREPEKAGRWVWQEDGGGSPVNVPPPPPPPPPPEPLRSTTAGSSSMPLSGVAESLRNLELPQLPMYGTDGASLAFGDWMTVIEPLMTDVSSQARGWWQDQVRGVEAVYASWLTATPLQRLRLKPHGEVAMQNQRIEHRGISMLLAAIPEPLRKDLIASRSLSTTSILFKLYCTYQPGGTAERATLLKQLTEVKPGNQLREVLESVRLWRRWMSRAEELGVVLPDGLVLSGVMAKFSEALTKIGGSQVSYRLASVRQELGIDHRPGLAQVKEMAEFLQAEAEELTLVQGLKPPSSVGAAVPP